MSGCVGAFRCLKHHCEPRMAENPLGVSKTDVDQNICLGDITGTCQTSVYRACMSGSFSGVCKIPCEDCAWLEDSLAPEKPRNQTSMSGRFGVYKNNWYGFHVMDLLRVEKLSLQRLYSWRSGCLKDASGKTRLRDICGH